MIAVAAAEPPPPPPRPAIVADPIPYGAKRRADMRRYARRHYGIDRHTLSARTIVLHMTANDSYRATWNTFARNVRDPELRELPGTCTHFVVDERGRIFQLVALARMCRHTVGLNHVAIGIEHVGHRERDVLARPAVRRASVALVRWLQARHDIPVRHVIGHNENTRSPLHRERVARLRKQTHGDWPVRWMRRYRQLLR